MSQRRSTRGLRCPHCRINQRWCFCDAFFKYNNRTLLTVIIHSRERYLTSNTSSLALKTLQNSRSLTRGRVNEKLDFAPRKNHTPLFLFPDEDAHELSAEFLNQLQGPIELIVPDGTWRQAKKVKKREESLKGIQSIKVPTQAFEKIYTLRKAPNENALCTLEAIALALGILESKELEEKLLHLLSVMNERVEISRNPMLWGVL